MANTTSSAVVGAMAGMPAHLLGDSLWARIGRGFLNFTKPVFEKLGGVGTHTAFTFAVFWTSYIAMYNFYTAVDKHNLWGLQKYKIHPGKMEPQELNDKVVDGMKSGFWKGAVRMAAAYGVFFSFGRQPVFSFPKSPLSLLGNLVIGYFIFDFGFYWLHRMEHLPYFYKTWHKQHHEFKLTNRGATSWNDMRESFGIMVLNDLTAMVLKFDLFTWLCWTVLANYLDFHIHCGYKFPWNPFNLIEDPLVHDFHHYRNVGNYALTHWDMLFGTNKPYLEWQKRQAERKAKGLEEEAERRDDPDEAEDEAVAAKAE